MLPPYEILTYTPELNPNAPMPIMGSALIPMASALMPTEAPCRLLANEFLTHVEVIARLQFSLANVMRPARGATRSASGHGQLSA